MLYKTLAKPQVKSKNGDISYTIKKRLKFEFFKFQSFFENYVEITISPSVKGTKLPVFVFTKEVFPPPKHGRLK